MFCLLSRHSTYIAKILGKNKKDAFFTMRSIFTAFWSIFAVNMLISNTVYEYIKHYNFEREYTPLLIAISICLLVAALNVWQLMNILNKKCDSCGKAVNHWTHEVNGTLTIAVCFLLSFVSALASLTEHPSFYIKVVGTVVVVFVFLLEKLLFGNSNQK